MSLPRIESCMDRQTHAVRVHDDLYEVVRTLIDESVTGAVVVDEQGIPVGVISEAECLKLLSEGDEHRAPQGTVEDFMAEIITVRPEMNIYHVAGLFNANPTMRRFAVVDDDGRLIAVVTRKDILKLVHSQLMQAAIKNLS